MAIAAKVVTTVRRRINLEEVRGTNGLTPRVERLMQRYREAGSRVSAEKAWYLTESYKLTEGEHTAKRKAKAFANVCAKTPIVIRDDELIVGGQTPYIRGANPMVESHPLALAHIFRENDFTTSSKHVPSTCTPEDKERLLECCEYWKDKYPGKALFEKLRAYRDGLLFKMYETGLGTPFLNHSPWVVACGADYDRILSEGVNSFIQEAKDEIARLCDKGMTQITSEDTEKIEYLEACIIAMEGIINLARRHAALAREMAAKESNPERKKELEKIAEICDWVPANPARNLHEALQSYWLFAIGHDWDKSFHNHFAGRFDQYMHPFYEKDVREGRLTRQEAAELLGCIFMKWVSLDVYWWPIEAGKPRELQDATGPNYIVNVTVGGVDRRGRDASNELSCLVLQVAQQVRTHQPHISLRYHRAMAPELLEAAIDCTREHGAGIPAWFNDNGEIQYLLDRGVSMEDARDWAMADCVNPAYHKGLGWCRPNVWGISNQAKFVLLALNDGLEETTGIRMGPATGDARDFKTFDEVMEAYKKQVEYFYDLAVNIYKENWEQNYKSTRYFPFISSFLQDCIRKGTDVTLGGGRYPQLEAPQAGSRGLNDAADCLTAIKKVVFEDKTATMAELRDALKADFEGYEDLRAKLIAAPKYGNDDEYADSVSVEVWENSVDLTLRYRIDFPGMKNARMTLLRNGAAVAQWQGARDR